MKIVDMFSNSPSFISVTTPLPKPTKVVENLIDLEQDGPVMTANDFECIVMYDFETHEEDRLDVKQGTVLRISQDEEYIDPDWWFGTTTDNCRSGWVPINYCKRL